MLLDLKFSIGTLGIGSGAFIAALYGMNLKNFMEDSDFGFLGVSGLSFVFAGIICAYGLTKLRKVQRVTMWGESGRGGKRGSWRELEGGHHSMVGTPGAGLGYGGVGGVNGMGAGAGAGAGAGVGGGVNGVGGVGGMAGGEDNKKMERVRFHQARGPQAQQTQQAQSPLPQQSRTEKEKNDKTGLGVGDD